jgi:hypothetical protein
LPQQDTCYNGQQHPKGEVFSNLFQAVRG